ncbi:Ger(x)C family spore germination protein [Thermoflavimicrobium dichotomicum]|uniref:Germination protein, Ger(X)C family n=1 Tax=Thermoflavimicrobium dichotomicum TaxID=46223 RepID=A0A1I3KJR3_9BACL|nr:Ger(x)C family spore germination protein [Thermoflavimicrobium dichotomicum]SFI72722.1 germination protein, Ger(x)C family [Thermoflavimicrobium dichotomicum]
MRRVILILVSMWIPLFLSGCWDQDLLREVRLGYGIGFDLTPEGKLFATLVVRDVPSGEQQKPIDDIFSATSRTPREARDKLDKKLSGRLRGYKYRVVLISEERAKQDIYPLLDVFYRDPKMPLNTRIAVVKGRAADVLFLRELGGTVPIAKGIDELIASEEELTSVPKINVRSICPVMLDPGEDFVLPYLMKKEERVEVIGTAMFHQHQMVGTLSPDESTVYLLLKGKKAELARFTRKVEVEGEREGESPSPYDFITIEVKKAKQEMNVLVNKQEKIKVQLNATWKVNVIEYPRDQLDEESNVAKLNKILSKDLTRLAKQTIQKMQKARCDGFGVGRQLIAFHPEVWKKKEKNWASEYQQVQFDTKVEVEITQKGIIN